MQQFNDLYFKTIASDNTAFDIKDTNELIYLAYQCPLSGGEVVYKARALYALIMDTVFDDFSLCDTSNNQLRSLLINNSPTVTSDTITTFKLFPNPAKDQVTVTSNNPFCASCQLVIYDISSQKVFTLQLPEGMSKVIINTAILQSGLYMVSINDDSGEVFNSKLGIIK